MDSRRPISKTKSLEKKNVYYWLTKQNEKKQANKLHVIDHPYLIDYLLLRVVI